MAHRVQSVSMIDQNILQAIFIGGEVIQYDLRKMLSILPQFQEIINDPSLASKVHADTGGYGVSWSDDLGRIVVPKEIRRTLRIREGDPLEIFTDREGEIILKKYSPIGELSQFAGEYAESLAQTTGHLVLITDCDHVVTASGTGKKEYEGKPISKQLEDAISERKNFLASRNDAEFVKVTLDDAGEFGQQALSTIICEGDAIGAVILYEKDEKSRMTETESKLAIAAAGFLGKQMEQ
jgi:AbrB family transcriptional regulator, stage V sporulation protein T